MNESSQLVEYAFNISTGTDPIQPNIAQALTFFGEVVIVSVIVLLVIGVGFVVMTTLVMPLVMRRMHYQISVTRPLAPTLMPQLLPRPRLMQFLRHSIHRKLIWLTAPATFGKTALLHQWIVESEHPICYVALSDVHNMLSYFVHECTEAMQMVMPQFGKRFYRRFMRPEQFINELVGYRGELILIFDNYQTIFSAEIHTILNTLIHQTPSNIHIVVSSRMTPPLHIDDLRQKGQLAELDADMLRFTMDETEQYISNYLPLLNQSRLAQANRSSISLSEQPLAIPATTLEEHPATTIAATGISRSDASAGNEPIEVSMPVRSMRKRSRTRVQALPLPGGAGISPHVLMPVITDEMEDQYFMESLSDRELEVLNLIAYGLSNQDVAERLSVSLNTVKAHLKNIYSKLNVHSRTQAIAQARQLKLLDNRPQ